MTLDLDAIEARCEAATEGPWHKDGIYRVFAPTGQIVAYSMNSANREFVQHAREDVPALLAEVRRLQAVVEQIKAEAWDEGYYASETGWIHAYDGHVIDPDGDDTCLTCPKGNPYRAKGIARGER